MTCSGVSSPVALFTPASERVRDRNMLVKRLRVRDWCVEDAEDDELECVAW
jgi:hypothetical protein